MLTLKPVVRKYKKCPQIFVPDTTNRIEICYVSEDSNPLGGRLIKIKFQLYVRKFLRTKGITLKKFF